MNKQLLIQTALILFGNVVIEDVFDLVKASSPVVAYDAFRKMSMDRFAECAQFLFGLDEKGNQIEII